MYSTYPWFRFRLIAMNAPLLPEILMGSQPVDQRSLDLATEGVMRYVWESAFGAMLIEVRKGAVYVNGGLVTPIAELRSASPVA